MCLVLVIFFQLWWWRCAFVDVTVPGTTNESSCQCESGRAERMVTGSAESGKRKALLDKNITQCSFRVESLTDSSVSTIFGAIAAVVSIR